MLFAVFNRLTEDLMERVAYQGGPWNEVRREAMQTGYKHAAENPDLYRACLSYARTRQAYLSILNRYAEQNFRDRLKALNRQPRIPVPVMARGFVGAHLVILEAWLPASSTVTSKSSPAWPWTFSSPRSLGAGNPPRRARIRNRVPGRAGNNKGKVTPSSACQYFHGRGCCRRITVTLCAQARARRSAGPRCRGKLLGSLILSLIHVHIPASITGYCRSPIGQKDQYG